MKKTCTDGETDGLASEAICTRASLRPVKKKNHKSLPNPKFWVGHASLPASSMSISDCGCTNIND